MRDLYPQDDPRFVATRVLVDAEEEEGAGPGRSNDLKGLMDSLRDDSHVVYIHEDLDDELVLRATWHYAPGEHWEVFEVETEMDLLTRAEDLMSRLERTKLAALAKSCLLRLSETHGTKGYESLSLGELDSITDMDPELD